MNRRDDLHRGRMGDDARDGRALDLAFELEWNIVEPAQSQYPFCHQGHLRAIQVDRR
jgi:hypothetical protein